MDALTSLQFEKEKNLNFLHCHIEIIRTFSALQFLSYLGKHFYNSLWKEKKKSCLQVMFF